MSKVRFLLISTLLLAFSFQACLQSNAKQPKHSHAGEAFFVDKKGDTIHTIQKSVAQWKSQLDPLAFHVLREKGTERAFTGKFDNHKKPGVYTCNGCGLSLFSSGAKFDSGTGWPSFDREIKGNVAFGKDNDLGYSRDEEHCASCGGHLGHVFNDGPDTTGKRHCINGVALKFVPEK
jgi:peptide-methionine (R)-S-oxide reductase